MENKFCETILEFVVSENEKLKKCNKGIFFMHELALTYNVGEKLYHFLNPNFEKVPNYSWEKEYNLNNEGRTDLVYLSKSKKRESIALEIKMDDTWMEYKRDFKKLSSAKLNTPTGSELIKYFCGLKLVLSEEQANQFIEQLKKNPKNYFSAILITQRIFETINVEKKALCSFTFWKIINTK